MKPTVHVSNHFKSLRQQLARTLFSSKAPSFQKKILILPDLRKKHELMREFLKEVDVVLGLDVMELEAGLAFLTRSLTGETLNLPPLGLLALHIFPFIEKSCTEKNAYHFAKALAVQFLRYGNFGGQRLSKWENEKGWQQTIWKAVFSKWDPPSKLLDLHVDKVEEICEVHLYHFPFLPMIYHQFFEKASLFCPVHYYQFSPCMEFWTDISSEKVRLYLENKVNAKVRKEWSSYLGNRPLLLAHFGALAKQTFRFFEEADFPLKESYVSPGTSTMLHQIQRQILHYGKKPDLTRDHSLTLHAVTSRQREVEVLYTNLLSLDFNPSQIRVYAPDISTYAPWISLIFDTQESHFPFSISDLPKDEGSPLICAFIQLLDLNNQRFSLRAVLELFMCPSLRRKFSLEEGEIRDFKIWMQEGGVKWGVDSQHRQDFFSGREVIEKGESGTWEGVFHAILTSFAKLPKQPPLWGRTILDFSQAQTFGKCVSVVRALREDLDFLGKGFFSLSEWSQHLRYLLNRYFKPDEQELVTFSWMEEKIKRLDMDFAPTDSYGFYPVATYLKAAFQKKSYSRGESQVEMLRFSSLKLGALDDACVICLLGLDEHQFPRSEPRRSLQEFEMQEHPCAQAEDRHLFLEALFAANRRLILSYVSVNEKDGKEQHVSPIVQELLDFIHPVTIICKHPPFSFHKDYFKQPSYASQSAFLMAKQYYAPERRNTPLIPEFLSAGALPEHGNENLELSSMDLERFAKHPLRFYLNRILRLYLQYEDVDDAFYLSRLNQFLLQERAYTSTFDQAFQEAELGGRLPLGRFKEVAKYAMHQKAQKMQPRQDSICLSLALEVPLGCHRFAKIKGSLFDVTREGMLFHGKKSMLDLLKIWPLYLSHAYQTKQNTLIFTQTGERLTLQDPEGALSAYLIYYEKAQRTPSPFLPRWADIFLNKDPEQLAKKIQTEKDPYVRWIFRPHTYDPVAIFDTWLPLLQTTFYPLERMLS